MQIKISTIKFPELSLHTRDAHKLRGYFGNLFKEHSPLLHNHFSDGSHRYAYPLVQYKVINKIPFLVGLNEGAELLTSLFLEIKELIIDETKYHVYSKNIENRIHDIDVTDDLYQYEFTTLWMALNQGNHKKYISLDESKKKIMLKKILTGNILSFYKGMDFFTDKQIMLTTDLQEKQTKFKDNKMMAFSGNFTTNAVLPDLIGLGKAVSRGFGTIIKKN